MQNTINENHAAQKCPANAGLFCAAWKKSEIYTVLASSVPYIFHVSRLTLS